MSTSTRTPSTRRQFLQHAGRLAVTAVAAPLVVDAAILGRADASPPSERIATGHIGLGGRGRANLARYAKESVIALCDVDRKHLAEARRGVPSDRFVDVVADYRRLLDRKDLDAVVISTPDHWHALQTIHACQAGKHVYCEKPLTLTIAEGRAMVKAARDAKRVVQTGSQQRSAPEFRKACEIVRSGLLGDVKEVLVGIPGVNYAGPPVADSTPPAELDFDLWLGPAPARPYNEKRVHYQFRFFWDYSGGQQTNWGAHQIDIAQWGLAADDSGPVEVSGTAKLHNQGWYEVPESYELTYRYSSGVTLRVGSKQPDGTTFIGSRGRLHVNRGKLSSDPPEIAKTSDDALKVKLPRSPGHQEDWEACIRSGSLPICDVEIGHRSATVCHLGNIALRLGRPIRWDPKREEIVGDADAARWVTKPYRAPWKLG